MKVSRSSFSWNQYKVLWAKTRCKILEQKTSTVKVQHFKRKSEESGHSSDCVSQTSSLHVSFSATTMSRWVIFWDMYAKKYFFSFIWNTEVEEKRGKFRISSPILCAGDSEPNCLQNMIYLILKRAVFGRQLKVNPKCAKCVSRGVLHITFLG